MFFLIQIDAVTGRISSTTQHPPTNKQAQRCVITHSYPFPVYTHICALLPMFAGSEKTGFLLFPKQNKKFQDRWKRLSLKMKRAAREMHTLTLESGMKKVSPNTGSIFVFTSLKRFFFFQNQN